MALNHPLSDAERAAIQSLEREWMKIAFTPAWTREAYERLRAKALAVTDDPMHYRFLDGAAEAAWLYPDATEADRTHDPFADEDSSPNQGVRATRTAARGR